MRWRTTDRAGVLTIQPKEEGWTYATDGAFVKGRLEGHVSHEMSGTDVTSFRQEVEYLEGEWHGRFESWRPDGEYTLQHYVRGKRHGQAAGEYPNASEHRGGETLKIGQYVDDERDGRWVYEYGDGGSSEIHYSGGELGLAIQISPSGERYEARYLHGDRHQGEWIRVSGGRTTVVVRYADGTVTDVLLPGADLPTSSASGGEPLDGGFGLVFGPKGVEQIRGLLCLEPVLNSWPGTEDVEVSCVSQLGSEIESGEATLRLKRPPAPITGGRHYEVRVDAEVGVRRITGHLGRYDENWLQCEEEAQRISAIVAEKYGTCREFRRYDGEEQAVAGKCDGRRLPERKVVASCDYSSNYVVSEDGTTDLDMRELTVRVDYYIPGVRYREQQLELLAKHGQATAAEF